MTRHLFPSVIFSLFLLSSITAQPDRWQQRVDYVMDIDFDVSRHQFQGKQTLRYTNNSPDTLRRVFYHLYFNAFQPGSMMDWQNRRPGGGDSRVGERIAALTPEESGWHRVRSLTCNGKPTRYEVKETVLEVWLPEPILPNTTALLAMDFESQVPVQIRRSGRNSSDGVDYSMSQWYPKLAEYDYQGWHPDLYVGREFYGVWGDFEVNISIERRYVMGASGVLQNPAQTGFGYEPPGTAVRQPPGEKLTWRWKAENVHDFSWTADPDYLHRTVRREDGLNLHFLFQPNEKTQPTWEKMTTVMPHVFDFVNERFGPYAYPAYSFLEAGDGGMEYPMATFLRAGSGVGTFVHEMMHAWYYGMLGSNEGKHPWMDEGFTEYASAEVINWLRQEGHIPGSPVANPHQSTNSNYISFLKRTSEEPLTTYHDHYQTSRAGNVGAYLKGHVLLTQLHYVIGKQAFDKGMLDYYRTWRFKHPNPDDFFRIMERASGMELDWFQQYFQYGTKQVDYAIRTVEKANRQEIRIVLERPGQIPMPIDLVITFRDGTSEMLNIPLSMMWGAKPNEGTSAAYSVQKPWGWTIPQYAVLLKARYKDIARVEIDPSGRMLDMQPENNAWTPSGKDGDE